MARLIKRGKCFLPDYKLELTLQAQDVKDKMGWQITAFNLPNAWKHSQGEGVVVAVLDSGCDLRHPDLQGNLKVIKGSNFIEPNKPPFDDNAHGTHCTGIIASGQNNRGIIGVAPKCKVMPIKVLDKDGNGDMDKVAKAIRFAVNHGADIISMSLGAPFAINNVRKSIQWADRKGVPVFCAAGNAGRTKAIYFPANYPETIAIGSIDEDFGRSKFSNTGKNLDFMAPGGRILGPIPGGGYGIMSGTSMACPFAVGVAALLLSWSRKTKKIALRGASDYRKLIKEHTMPISDKKISGKKFFQGFGIIDTTAFIEWVNTNKVDPIV